MSIQKRGRKWQVALQVNGVRHRPSFDNYEDAQRWENAARLAVTEGKPIPKPESLAVSQRFGEFANSSFEYLWGDVKSTQKMRVLLSALINDVGPDTQLSTINTVYLKHLVQTWRNKGNANATVNRKLAQISRLLKHAYELEIVTRVPPIPRLKEAEGRTRFLSEDEETNLLHTFHVWGMDQYKNMTTFLLYTGCRCGEALNLKWTDVNFEKNLVTFWETKGGRARTIPLPKKALQALEDQQGFNPHGPFRGFTYDGYKSAWDRIRAELGYAEDPQYVPHMLRHTCASRLVQRGQDIRRVKEWMGHAAIQVTARYAHLAPDDLDQAAKVLDN